MATNIVRSPIKWVGGKGWLAPNVEAMLPGRIQGRYLEPFAGSLAVLLHIRRSGFAGPAHATDANDRLAWFWTCVKQCPQDLLREYEAMRAAYNGSDSEAKEELYYGWRTRFSGETPSSGSAARFLALNRAGYNGLYRTNRSGAFNVPWGKLQEMPYLTDVILHGSRSMRATRVTHGDWRSCMANADGGDAIYVDAPYAGTFVGYTREGWTHSDDAQLGASIAAARGRGATVVWSLPGTDEARQLVSGLFPTRVEEVSKRGMVSPGVRTDQHELLVQFRP